MPVQRTFQASDGVIASEQLASEPEQMYATPEEMGQLFGMRVTEQQIRFGMALMHSYCHRPSLFVTEYQTPPLRLPTDRMETRLPVTPVVRIMEAAGRYAYDMRRDGRGWNQMYYGAAAVLALQGATPSMVAIDVDLIQVDAATGIVVLPWGALYLMWSSVAFRYLAGYVDIPGTAKVALAEILNTVAQRGVSDRVAYTVGRISRKYASQSFITPQAEQLLSPFVVRSMY